MLNAVDVIPFATYGTARTENLELVLSDSEYKAMQTLRGLKRFRPECGNRPYTLFSILYLSTHMGSEATDPRDRIYGLLGLATDGKELIASQESLDKMLLTLTKSAIAVKRYLDVLCWQNREG